MRNALRRLGIILFWSCLILGFLYWPAGAIFPSKDKTITVFAWGDILDPGTIAEFEQETGIKVHLNYYASNEELIVKLKATNGYGYDLIIPSDYSVQILREEQLLKPLDKTQLNFLHHLNPVLLGHAYDPDNQYSLPFEWELFVIGIDKNFFTAGPMPSWDLIFSPQTVHYRIGMINDPIQAIAIAGFYLYGITDYLSEPRLANVVALLKEQKNWVAAYADFRADYFLASKNCPVVLSSTSYILRTMRRFPFVSFVVPKEGTFATIENLCIPKASRKEQLTYQLINFLYRPQAMAAHYNIYGVFPATTDVLPLLETNSETQALLFATADQFKHFHFTRPLASQQQLRNAWIQVKSGY